MWRTVFISSGQKMRLENKHLIVEGLDKSISVPIDDLYSVVLENPKMSLSAYLIDALSSNNIHVVLCNDKHMPSSIILPLNNHYRILNVLRKQMALNKDFKDNLWKKVIRSKINNQALVLRLLTVDEKVVNHLDKYAEEIQDGDISNREGLAAKMFFRSIYGANFIRFADGTINDALNYGYAIIRSAITRTLVSYGFNCVLGIHHVGETNPFNLTDDLMEPFRPLIDYWVVLHNDELVESLSRNNRAELVGIVNKNIMIDNKRSRIRYAIDRYIRSFVTAIEQDNTERMIFPIVVSWETTKDSKDEQPIYENPSLF